MNVLNYKIISPGDIESISDELAGFNAAIRVTQAATIQVVFENEIDDDVKLRIDSVMTRLGTEPVAA